MPSILITGGTGFFGSNFVRVCLEQDRYERICIFSRSESAQARLNASLRDPESRCRFFIGDVRDQPRLARAFFGVEHVIHAAALKRIEVGHYNPDEMVKTNISGSLNVIEAAAHAGVKKVILLSTDKAFQPVSPYGLSKAMAESLFLNANNLYGQNGPRFHVMRFGNIFGSTGSVIHHWLTDPDPVITDLFCTRFFMSVRDEIKSVIRVLDHDSFIPQQIIIPPNPKAFLLRDLAMAMRVEPRVVGIPYWEKKHESLDKDTCSRDAPKMKVSELRAALEELKHVDTGNHR